MYQYRYKEINTVELVNCEINSLKFGKILLDLGKVVFLLIFIHVTLLINIPFL